MEAAHYSAWEIDNAQYDSLRLRDLMDPLKISGYKVVERVKTKVNRTTSLESIEFSVSR